MITLAPWFTDNPIYSMTIGAILLLWIAAVGTRSHH